MIFLCLKVTLNVLVLKGDISSRFKTNVPFSNYNSEAFCALLQQLNMIKMDSSIGSTPLNFQSEGVIQTG
jgi:hypothetical protein